MHQMMKARMKNLACEVSITGLGRVQAVDFVKAQHAAMHCCALVMDGEVISVILWVQVWVLNAVELHGLADMIVALRGSTAEAVRRAAAKKNGQTHKTNLAQNKWSSASLLILLFFRVCFRNPKKTRGGKEFN
jgi:hypothetical protein